MQNVKNTEAGNPPIATWNNIPAKFGQKGQSEDRPPDFLTDALSKLLGLAKQGSTESQGNSEELNGLGKESPNLPTTESIFPKGQSEIKDSGDQALGFRSESTGLKDQIKESGKGDQENEVIHLTAFPALESLFIGKGDVPKGFLNKTEQVISSLSNALLLMKGVGAVAKADQSPIAGAQASGKGSGKRSPGLANPNQEIPIEGESDKGVFLKEEGSNSGLDSAPLLNIEEGLILQFTPLRDDGNSASAKDFGKGSPALVNPNQEMPIEGQVDKGIFLKDAGSNSSLIGSFLLNDGKCPVTESDQSLIDGALASGKSSGKGNFGLVNSSEESPLEGRGLKRSLDLKDGVNPPWDDNLLLNKLKTFVEKITQPLEAGPARNMANPEEAKLGLKKSIEQTPGKDDFPGEGLSAEIIKVRPTQDRPSSNSIMIEKVEGEPSEKAKEGQPGLSLFFKEGFFNDPRGPLAATNREKLEMTFDSDGLNNKNYFQRGEAREGKEASHTPNSSFNMTDYVLRDSMGLEKLMNDKPNPINHIPKSFDPDFIKDYYFTIKKQTSSSMEISLEPAGLGKLDIELKLTQDRLQGQIMVNDRAGKELIEKNLPQLFSDLAREGLQIGGFTVSLRNQGRGQNPIPFQMPTDFEEPLLMPVSPEKIVPIQGNHLIHIII